MRSKVIAHNSFLTAVDILLYLAGSLVTVVLVARVMGPIKLGYYAYVMWIIQVANVVGVFGVPAATRKYVAEFLGKGDVATTKALVRTTFRLQLVSSSVLVTMGIAIALTILPPEHRGYTVLALLSLLPAMLLAIPGNVNSAIEDFASNVYPSIVSQVVNFVGVVLTLWLKWDLVGLSGSMLLSRSVDFGLRYYLFQRRFPKYLKARFGEVPPAADALPAELRTRMVRFCWQATGLLALNLVVWDRSEIFFLKHFCEISQVAFYSMSFGVMKALANLPDSFARAAGASLMAQHGLDPEPLPSLTATILRFQALIVLPLALGMAALSSPFVNFFYGHKYQPAVPVLTIVALFSVSSALISVVNQLFIASDQQGILLKWGIITGILNLILDWWWIPSKGAIGAALANGVAQLVGGVGIWAFAVRQFTIPLPWQALLKVAFSAVAMAALVETLGHALPPAPATILGVFTGAGMFLFLLRLTRSLDQTDRKRLMSIQRLLPRWLQNWYALGLQMVIA